MLYIFQPCFILPLWSLGKVNGEGLREYLASENLPFVVAISEDATSVKGNRKYSAKRNSIIGNSLPLGTTDLPNAEDAVVNSAMDIIKMISQRATVVFVVMAQPLVDSFPPMRICTFGSDNKLSFNDVRHRLQTIRAELEKFGIEILTYSADGDSRELKMMREHMKLGLVPKICKCINCILYAPVC